jgi:hypothetical protein
MRKEAERDEIDGASIIFEKNQNIEARYMRRYSKYISYVLVLFLSIFTFLNAMGFCASKGRFINNDELVRLAIAAEIQRKKASPDFLHQTVATFLKAYEKNCCMVAWWSKAWEPVILKMIFLPFGCTHYTVYLRYEKTLSFYLIDACGNVRTANSIIDQ